MYEEMGFSFIQNSIKAMLAQLDFDSQAFVKHPEFKKGVASFATAAKAAAKAPFDLDDKGIDQLVLIIDSVIETQKNLGPIEVGMTAEDKVHHHEVAARPAKAWRSRKEVEDLIVAEGGDPKGFAPWVLIGLQFIQFLPQLIAMIQQFMGNKTEKKSAKATAASAAAKATAVILLMLFSFADLRASDHKVRGRAAWAWCDQANTTPAVEAPVVYREAPKAAHNGSDDALAEVNEYRAKRGLAPFKHDAALTEAALKAAKQRASRGIHGHLPESDFTCLPAGAHADAAGCGALDDSWGWGTCCMDENYAYAGAAWIRGSDGRRYMHLFVSNSPANSVKQTAVEPVRVTSETVCDTGTCSTGQCSSGVTVRQYGGLLSRGRRGR